MKSTMKNMVLSLSIVAASLGALLAWVHQLTAVPIAEAARKAKIEALSSVLPAFDDDPEALAVSVHLPDEEKEANVYPAHKDGNFVGAAVESWSMAGFSGEIRVMVGFDDKGRLVGYEVLSHNETPGLGAMMDDWFRSEYGCRSVIGSDSYVSIKKDGGEIDGITAATISSRAFMDAVNRARSVYNRYNDNR